jgi:hypothetical protein
MEIAPHSSLNQGLSSIASEVVFTLDEVVTILLETYPNDPMMKAVLQKIRDRVESDAKVV